MIEFLKHIASCAGAHAMRFFRSDNDLDVAAKLNDSDIVTIADKECEAIIRGLILDRYPDHSILSEESEPVDGSSPFRWVIDPIDGTTNFATGIPFWAISIGLEVDGVTRYAVVYAPALNEMFIAERGKGAFLNGRPIHVSEESKLSRCVLATGFPVDRATNPDNNLLPFETLLPQIRDMRRLGAASVDMCYVAAGFLQGYWELNLHEWDVNAASLIVEEAGGLCTRFRNDHNICLLAAPPAIHDRLLPLLA